MAKKRNLARRVALETDATMMSACQQRMKRHLAGFTDEDIEEIVQGLAKKFGILWPIAQGEEHEAQGR